MASSNPKVKNLTVSIQNVGNRTIFATWSKLKVSRWKNNDSSTKKKITNTVKGYEYRWAYYISDTNKPFKETSWTEVGADIVAASYTADADATKVKFFIRPVPKTYTVTKKVKGKKKTETKKYFTPGTAEKSLSLKKIDTPPPAPTISVNKYTLTASLSNLSSDISKVQFQIVRDNTTKSYDTTVSVKKGYASISPTMGAGHVYKVRCRTIGGGVTSLWSDYSENTSAIPASVKKFNTISANSSSSIFLSWPKVTGATSYEINYVTKLDYFDTTPGSTITTENTSIIIEGLDSGTTYFFRIRAADNNQVSKWYPASSKNAPSLTLGREPAAPTTYSIVSSLKVGESVRLYWIHNSQDNSVQREAEIHFTFSSTILGTVERTINVQNTNLGNEFTENDNLFYTIDTSKAFIDGSFILDFSDGVTIEWKVRTRGIINKYSEWSVSRKIEVYAPPTLSLLVSSTLGEWVWDPFNFNTDTIYATTRIPIEPESNIFTSLPIAVEAESGPINQTPVGYYIDIVNNDDYDYEDEFGISHYVPEGQSVYSTYFNSEEFTILRMINASDVTFEDGQEYTITVKVVMNSGLTAEASYEFVMDWEDVNIFPDADISINDETFTASLIPYCLDRFDDIDPDETESEDEEIDIDPEEVEDLHLVENVSLFVYRQNVDGEFVEIASSLNNLRNISVVDPHPTLNYVRYRIVARNLLSGQIVYHDCIPQDVDQPGILITWDEQWKNMPADLEYNDEYMLDEEEYMGSLLKLPYNVDVSEKNNPDIELVNYIGRKRSVSYYGTHLGETVTFKAEVPIDDEDTLSLIRSLSVYMGDVYIREFTTRIGYWASIKVSFDTTHCSMVVPVTIEATRVEGGM